VAWWIVVPSGAVALLWVADRGQHRALIERLRQHSPVYVLTLSVGASLLNSALFCTLAYMLGYALRWWWSGPSSIVSKSVSRSITPRCSATAQAAPAIKFKSAFARSLFRDPWRVERRDEPFL
jgi:hypothetical protein